VRPSEKWPTLPTTCRKFSEVETVASRNSLYQILEANVALGTRLRAKSCCHAR
jgi:hypothetical protein